LRLGCGLADAAPATELGNGNTCLKREF